MGEGAFAKTDEGYIHSMKTSQRRLTCVGVLLASALYTDTHAQVAWRTNVDFPAGAAEVERISEASDGTLGIVVSAADGFDRYELRYRGEDGAPAGVTELPHFCRDLGTESGAPYIGLVEDLPGPRFRLIRSAVTRPCGLATEAETSFFVGDDRLNTADYRVKIAEPYLDEVAERVYVYGLVDYNFENVSRAYRFREFLYVFDAETLAPLETRVGPERDLGAPPTPVGIAEVRDGEIVTRVTAPHDGSVISVTSMEPGGDDFEQAAVSGGGIYVNGVRLSAAGTAVALGRSASGGPSYLAVSAGGYGGKGSHSPPGTAVSRLRVSTSWPTGDCWLSGSSSAAAIVPPSGARVASPPSSTSLGWSCCGGCPPIRPSAWARHASSRTPLVRPPTS